MAKTWSEEGRARTRENRRKKREAEAKRRRARVQAVIHPVKTARKRWLPW